MKNPPPSNRLLLALLLAVLSLLSGCATKTEEDSQLPWSQPAPWEGTMPGMPGNPAR